jgi:hypothetical protein
LARHVGSGGRLQPLNIFVVGANDVGVRFIVRAGGKIAIGVRSTVRLPARPRPTRSPPAPVSAMHRRFTSEPASFACSNLSVSIRSSRFVLQPDPWIRAVAVDALASLPLAYLRRRRGPLSINDSFVAPFHDHHR